MKVGNMGGISAKTIEWQCSGCDHLCKLLTDNIVKPNEIIKCVEAKFKEC